MTDIRNARDEHGVDATRIFNAYRTHAKEQPSAALDQRILAMAAAATTSATSATRAPSRPLAWMRYAASVAVVVVGAGLTWRMVTEGPAPGRGIERPQVAESAGSTSSPPAPSAPRIEQAADQAAPSAGAGSVSERSTSNPKVHLAAAETEAAMADAATPPSPVLADAAPQVRAPVSAEGLTASRSAAAAQVEELRAVASAPAASIPMREAAPPEPPSAALPAAKRAVVSPLDPQAWLQSVRALRDSGHVDEARVSLREWRLRYPQLPVPEDLQLLLDQPTTRPSASTPSQ